jgi:hypothetical protein
MLLALMTVLACADAATSGNVPPATITAAKEDLAGKLDVAVDAIEIVMAMAVTWNDGALGCGQPGQAHIQALVPGYQIILEVEGKRYDYRATEQGYLLLCELPSTLPRAAESRALS